MEAHMIPQSLRKTAPTLDYTKHVDKRRTSLPLLRTSAAARVNGANQNLTPPDTPTSPVSHEPARHRRPEPIREEETQQQQQDQQPEQLFHNYLRAFHAFDPSPDDEASSITVSIRQGDLILVHSIHANGWADGTLLTTGARGWLPTNYCEAYDHPYMRNLLNAMTQFWDLLGDGENASFSSLVRQDYVRGLIAGVRFLLEHTNCLHRGAASVLRHVGIRRMRKGLLADLSSMVQKAKELQEEASQPYAGEVVHIVLDELITKAFKVVTRAVKFVDIWLQETAVSPPDNGLPQREPPTPPVDADDGDNGDEQPLTPYSPNKQFVKQADPSADQQPQPASAPATARDTKRRSQAFKRNSITSHRLSLVSEDKTGNMASGQLAQAHDECISLMGQFLGHHMQSRSPAELFENTQRLVAACTRLVAIMDQVRPLATGRVVSMHQSQMVFKTELDELVQSTKEVFTFSDHADDEVVILPEQISRVVANGTRLIRAVGECVANTRRLLERVGDFEMEQGWSVVNQVPAPPTVEEQTAEQTSTPNGKAHPMPPTSRQRAMTAGALTTLQTQDQKQAISTQESRTSLPAATKYHRPLPRSPASPFTLEPAMDALEEQTAYPNRKDSVSTSGTELSATMNSGLRDSEMTAASQISTRATTPDSNLTAAERREIDAKLLTSFASVSSMASAATDCSHQDMTESTLLHKTFAHELVLNQQGQVAGGSLPALVEQFTSHDSTPDPTFAMSFLLTFRMFTNAVELAEALIDRFDYIGDSKTIGFPVRLRVCNFFKSWLENYWNTEADKAALPLVRQFALQTVKPHISSAADRLLEATRKVTLMSQSGGPSPTALTRAITFGAALTDDTPTPEMTINKAQINMLRRRSLPGGDCTIVDLDALEIARQLTLLASRIYCNIQAEELLSLAWNKKGSNKAPNVRNLSRLNTELSFLVGESILSQEDAKKRALVIKHWVKVAMPCLTLRNFESLFAITASLMVSHIARMKKTWELVSKKTKLRFDELKVVIDSSGNSAAYRRRIDEALTPCIPFLAIHLSDLMFSDAGNPATRPLANTSDPSGKAVTVINFTKYTQMSRVVSLVQRFQCPYSLQSCVELQSWLESCLSKQRESTEETEKALMARSHVLEPRQGSVFPPKTANAPPLITAGSFDGSLKTGNGDDRKEQSSFFAKHNGFGFKSALGKSEQASTLALVPADGSDAVEGGSRN